MSYRSARSVKSGQREEAWAARIATGGFTGGALRVSLGGIDAATILNMSGGWSRSFDLPRSGRLRLSLQVRLTQTAEYEADELSQTLVSLDGALAGVSPDDFVAQIAGDGNGGAPRTTGWQLVTLDLGTRSAGSHRLVLGGFNNKKTLANESTEVLVDDVSLTVE